MKLKPTPEMLCDRGYRASMRQHLQDKVKHSRLPCGPDPDDVRQLTMLEALDMQHTLIDDLRVRVACLTRDAE